MATAVLVAPTERLRLNFKVVPNSEVYWGQSPLVPRRRTPSYDSRNGRRILWHRPASVRIPSVERQAATPDSHTDTKAIQVAIQAQRRAVPFLFGQDLCLFRALV